MAWDDPAGGDGSISETEWDNMVSDQKSRVQAPATFVGQFLVQGTGNISVTEPGFQPSAIKFEGEAVGGQNVDRSGGGGSNDGNYAGSFTGFARDDGTRQVIHSGGSGNSINQTSHYSSDTSCIAIRYAGQSGGQVGKLEADVSSFDSNGFTVSVSSYSQNEVIIYTAYR